MAKANKEVRRYQTIAGVLGVAIIAQFFWWDKKCPQVLGGGKGYGKGKTS
jgi:hypothetical protein